MGGKNLFFSKDFDSMRSYMSRIERGLANPSLDAVEVLADALRVEVKKLFDTTSEPDHSPSIKKAMR